MTALDGHWRAKALFSEHTSRSCLAHNEPSLMSRPNSDSTNSLLRDLNMRREPYLPVPATYKGDPGTLIFVLQTPPHPTPPHPTPPLGASFCPGWGMPITPKFCHLLACPPSSAAWGINHPCSHLSRRRSASCLPKLSSAIVGRPRLKPGRHCYNSTEPTRSKWIIGALRPLNTG